MVEDLSRIAHGTIFTYFPFYVKAFDFGIHHCSIVAFAHTIVYLSFYLTCFLAHAHQDLVVHYKVHIATEENL